MATLKIIRGDTWRRSWLLTDANGAAIDLSGAVARLTVRIDASTLLYSTSTADPPSELSITPDTGRIDLVVPYAITEAWPIGASLQYDLEVTHAGGLRLTYELSALVVLKDVSYG